MLFAGEVCEAVSWAGMFLFWVLMMDGLKAQKVSWCFYLPKVIFHVIFLLAMLALQITKRPALFFPSLPVDAFKEDPQLVALVFALGLLFVFLVFVWTVLFVWSTVATSRYLRKLPYQPTRFQQLSFRFMLYQQFVVRSRGAHGTYACGFAAS